MQGHNINAGMTLRLKRDRAEAYGLQDHTVTVKRTYTRPGYKKIWIEAMTGEQFPASDFAAAYSSP